jgi:hypothetical protein
VNSFQIMKRTGTHADVLAAAGAADVLSGLKPRLTDRGNSFEVRLARPAAIDDLAGGPGFKYLKVIARSDEPDAEDKKKQRSSPDGIPSQLLFDYAAQNEKYKRQQVSKQAARKNRDRDVAESIAEDAPDPEFRSYRILNALQADSGTNKLVEGYLRHEKEWRNLVWAGFGGESGFPCDAPLVQLFNPQSAKGYSLLKPSGTYRNDKTKEKWANPFLEWLRYRGFFASCAGWFLGSKGEHIRLYCPIPGDISFDLYKGVVSDFRAEALAGSASKLDCLGTLRLTRSLILRSLNPARAISGIWVTQYQSMGQAKAVASIDQLALPDWFQTDAKDLWLQTLEEHDTVLRRMDDTISEELMLLKQYRRFLQREVEGSLAEFVEFLSSYGQHVFRQRGQGKWMLPQFSSERVEAILQIRYKEILDNQGFQAVAGALRSATVSAQAAKKFGQGDYREIQYGALPELRRKLSLGRDDFMQAVSDFLTGFNAESARRHEMGKTGFRVSQGDFAAFATLMDESPPELVGSLLCAVATCKRGKEENEDIAE